MLTGRLDDVIGQTETQAASVQQKAEGTIRCCLAVLAEQQVRAHNTDTAVAHETAYTLDRDNQAINYLLSYPTPCASGLMTRCTPGALKQDADFAPAIARWGWRRRKGTPCSAGAGAERARAVRQAESKRSGARPERRLIDAEVSPTTARWAAHRRQQRYRPR